MIPTSRPVLGKDLDTVRQQFGLLTADACFVFGLSITRWMQIVRQRAELPVKDPTLALLVRLLDQHPELTVVPRAPTPTELYETVNGFRKVEQKRFALMFGSENSAAYRWLRIDSRVSPAVSRLMLHFNTVLQSGSTKDGVKFLDDWEKVVTAEAAARGAEDVFRTGRWNYRGVAEESQKKAAELDEMSQPKRKKGVAARKTAVAAE